MISQLKMRLTVPAGARFMRWAVPAMLVALMAKFVAQNALDRPRNLERGILVASGAKVPTCSSCKSARVKESRPLRELTKLPTEVTQDKIFSKKGIPVFLCSICDAQELESALEAHQKRIDNK